MEKATVGGEPVVSARISALIDGFQSAAENAEWYSRMEPYASRLAEMRAALEQGIADEIDGLRS